MKGIRQEKYRQETNLIGTLNEKSIHRVLKKYLEDDESKHEIRVCGYVADIVTGDKIIEIQTRQFNKLRDKLLAYIDANYKVEIVYPVIVLKYINWVDPVSNEVAERRKSSLHGSILDIFVELYRIKEFTGYDNIDFKVITLESDEYKYLDGYGANNKNHATKIDKIPTSIISIFSIKELICTKSLLPFTVNDEFTSADLAKKAKCKIKTARLTLNILGYMGAVARVGKKGNNIVYKIQ